MENNKGIIRSSFDIYKRYYLRSVLLEVFGKNEPFDSDEEIKERIYSEIRRNKDMYHSIGKSGTMIEYKYLIKIGYLQMIENEMKITISDAGIKALRECVLENLASSAFFGYKSLSISRLAIIVAGLSLLVSLASFVLILCR